MRCWSPPEGNASKILLVSLDRIEEHSLSFGFSSFLRASSVLQSLEIEPYLPTKADFLDTVSPVLQSLGDVPQVQRPAETPPSPESLPRKQNVYGTPQPLCIDPLIFNRPLQVKTLYKASLYGGPPQRYTDRSFIRSPRHEAYLYSAAPARINVTVRVLAR